jgi:hypothetical protein
MSTEKKTESGRREESNTTKIGTPAPSPVTQTLPSVEQVSRGVRVIHGVKSIFAPQPKDR